MKWTKPGSTTKPGAASTHDPVTGTGVGEIQRHKIRDHTGRVWAVQCRQHLPDRQKRVWWELPDGRCGLHGLRTADMPLYGSHLWPGWDPRRALVLAEGVPATDALLHAGWCALGTITGAAGSPSDSALKLLESRDVILWPDADEAGFWHMLKVASRLWRVRSLRWVKWADAPEGGDAANLDAKRIRALILHAEKLVVPAKPTEDETYGVVRLSRSWPIAYFNQQVTVSDVLRDSWGVPKRRSDKHAVPGQTIHCPAHDDRSPSLSIAPDDRRVWCHSVRCVLYNDGRGRDAWDLHRLALEGGVS